MAKKANSKKTATRKNTKRCKHCKTKIKSSAKVCPNCGKKQTGSMKWILIGFIVIVFLGSFYTIVSSLDSLTGNEHTNPPDTTIEDENNTSTNNVPDENNATEPSAEPENEDPLGFHVSFRETYPNDVTGNWRLAMISENINIEEYALNYYNNYFKSNTEVHVIVNAALNTTACVTVIGNLLDVRIMEYVDNEENDAKIACSGMLLSEYHVNIDTSEMEKIQ